MKKGVRRYVGMDVGSSKTICMVGEESEKGLKIIGKGEVKTNGFRDGVVVDFASAVKTIKEAVRSARVYTEEEIENVAVTLGGTHVEQISVTVEIPISKKSITKDDIHRLIESAREEAKKRIKDQEKIIIHSTPYRFLVNGDTEVVNPEEMDADRLTAEVNVYVGDRNKIENFKKAFYEAGVNITAVFIPHYAMGMGVFNSEFREQVIGVIDLGHSLLKGVVFRNGKIEKIFTFLAGVQYITKDIGAVFRLKQQDAERLKKHGVALPSKITDPDSTVEARALNGSIRSFPAVILSEIISARQEEILRLVWDNMKSSPSFSSIKHVYLIGGGAKLKYVKELAEEIFSVDVTIGRPTGVTSIDNGVLGPEYVQVVGVIKALYSRGSGPERKSFFGKVGIALKKMFA